MIFVSLQAHAERLNLLGAVAVGAVHGPGQFEVKSRRQHFASSDRPPPAFQQCLLARLDENVTGRKNEHRELRQQQPRERPA